MESAIPDSTDVQSNIKPSSNQPAYKLKKGTIRRKFFECGFEAGRNCTIAAIQNSLKPDQVIRYSEMMKFLDELTLSKEAPFKEFDKIKDTIESNLTRPFRDFFDTLLDEGKVTFASFEQLIKDSLKRILSQAIATGLAQLFASLLSGGGTVAVSKIAGAAGVARALSDVGKIGGIFRRVAAPSFGGVSGGLLS